MRRILLLMAALLLLMTSCSLKNSGEAVNTQTEEKTTVTELKNEDLIKLIEENTVPPVSIGKYEPVTDGKGLPVELINKLGKAVYEGNADALIRTLDDPVFRVDRAKLMEDLNYDSESSLVNYLYNHDYIYYRIDTNGDGIDEIYGVDDDSAGYISMHMKSEEDQDIFRSSAIGDIRSFAVFKSDDAFYLAASCNQTSRPGEIDVNLYQLNSDDFGLDRQHNHICIQRKVDIANLNLVYKNTGFSAIDEMQAYVDEIIYDLTDVSRGYEQFYGDEREWDNPGRERLEYTVDVDNDGTDELFERFNVWNSYMETDQFLGTELIWYELDGKETPWPFTAWNHISYVKKKIWFKIFDGRTTVFTLYQKEDSRNKYVLDVRIHEGGKTALLLEYMFDLKISGTQLLLSEQIPYNSTTAYFSADVRYYDPDLEKAFPENLEELSRSLIARTQREILIENHQNREIPVGLMEHIKETSINRWLDYSIDSYFRRISKYAFREKYGGKQGEGIAGSIDWGDNEYVYEYVIDQNRYFFVPSGVYGPTSLSVHVYKETDGKLHLQSQFSSLDVFAASVYNNELYLLVDDQRSESRTLTIHKLAPETENEFAKVDIYVTGYKWEKYYGNNQPYEKVVTKYVDSIKEILSEQILQGEAVTYTGDEIKKIDPVKLQRLKSVSGDQEFYEIDFNNDGNPEYISKTREGQRYILSDVYRFEEKKTVLMNYSLKNHRFLDYKNGMSQIWFKELDGKIFTCKLIARGDYYVLNISLVEGTDISQAQCYMIVPKRNVKIQFSHAFSMQEAAV